MRCLQRICNTFVFTGLDSAPLKVSFFLIRKHYLDLKSTEEADRFWKIVPQGTKLPKLQKREGRFEPVKAKKRSKAT